MHDILPIAASIAGMAATFWLGRASLGGVVERLASARDHNEHLTAALSDHQSTIDAFVRDERRRRAVHSAAVAKGNRTKSAKRAAAKASTK